MTMTAPRRALAGALLCLVLAVQAAGAQQAALPAAAPAAPATAVPATPPAAAPAEATSAPAAPAAAEPAAAAGAPPAVARLPQETVENPYGLTALWQNGDLIAHGTLLILAIMSMGSWYVIITKFIEQTLLLRQAREAGRGFWSAPGLGEAAETLGARSAFRGLVEDGLRASEHHDGTLTQRIDLNTWIAMALQRSVDEIGNRLQNGLAFLATVGSTAPFVGLFGTVWGIYHALTAIGIAGQASIDKVAGPVGEALIMTAMGLAVAVPAVLGYNWMVRRNKAAMDRVRSFAGDLHARLIGGAAPPLRPVRRSA